MTDVIAGSKVVYYTTDGREFATRKEAVNHELRSQVSSIFDEYVCYGEIHLADLVDAIMKNADRLAKLCETIKRES